MPKGNTGLRRRQEDPGKRRQFSWIFKGEPIPVGWLGQNEETGGVSEMGSRNFFLHG